MFHLFTHAFFKALLFLAAGSVIMGMHHMQDIRYMGGLRKYMPITWITSLIGSLALIGTPLFSGFYSKDSIIEAVHATQYGWISSFANFAVLAGVFVTAFYSFRMYFLVFHGAERYDQNPDAHHDHGHGDHGHDAHAHDDHGHDSNHQKPHESPAVVTLPLMLLAIPSAIIGFIAIEPLLFGGYFKDSIVVLADKHPAMSELAKHWEHLSAHGNASLGMALHALSTAPFWLAAAGVATSWFIYMKRPDIATSIKAKCMPLYNLLDNKYYLDAFNQAVFARGARILGTGFWNFGDKKLIDGLLVNGSAQSVGWIASVLRLFQTGYIYHYAFGMIIGLVVMLYFVAKI